jgi:hypothetical protein
MHAPVKTSHLLKHIFQHTLLLLVVPLKYPLRNNELNQLTQSDGFDVGVTALFNLLHVLSK